MRGTGQGGTGGANSATSVSNGVAPVTSSDQWPPSATFRLARKPVLSFHRAKPTNSPLFTADSRLDVVDIGRRIYAHNKPTVNQKYALGLLEARVRRYICAPWRVTGTRERRGCALLVTLGRHGTPIFSAFLDVDQQLSAGVD